MLTILLQDAAGAQSPMSSMIMWILILVVMFVFMFLPQMRRNKELKKFREAMKKGDRVVTAGGIYGKVKEIKDTTILMTISEGVEIEIDKASVFGTSQEQGK
ncbi:MAG: preprotein translocase subunit YajC [Paludibacteraceae bacterium]|mgnify:CR=1 FL=1|nr:preprotein translocase subunit YajC [Paludibacteraceae bacterium]